MPLGARSKNIKRSIVHAEMMAKALDLKKAGLSFRQIATALKVSVGSAFGLVDEGRKSIPQEARDALVAEIHERELAIVAAHWTKRHIPEHAKVIQASDQFLARLLGLEAPKTMHFDVSKVSNEQLAALLGGPDPAVAGGGAEGTPKATSQGESSPPGGEDEGSSS